MPVQRPVQTPLESLQQLVASQATVPHPHSATCNLTHSPSNSRSSTGQQSTNCHCSKCLATRRDVSSSVYFLCDSPHREIKGRVEINGTGIVSRSLGRPQLFSTGAARSRRCCKYLSTPHPTAQSTKQPNWQERLPGPLRGAGEIARHPRLHSAQAKMHEGQLPRRSRLRVDLTMFGGRFQTFFRAIQNTNLHYRRQSGPRPIIPAFIFRGGRFCS
jgi:hypothetical protein